MPQFVHSKPPVNFVDVVALYRLAQLMHSDRRCCDESTVSRCQCFVVIHSSPITIYGNAAHARSVEITATIFFFFFFSATNFSTMYVFFFLVSIATNWSAIIDGFYANCSCCSTRAMEYSVQYFRRISAAFDWYWQFLWFLFLLFMHNFSLI